MTSCLSTLRTKSSQNDSHSSRREFAPIGAYSSLYLMTPIYIGGNNENDRADSPEWAYTPKEKMVVLGLTAL